MSDNFNEWDRFKGKYNSRPKEDISTPLNDWTEEITVTLPYACPIISTPKSDIIYSFQNEINNVFNNIMNSIEEDLKVINICEHEPIDVGFNCIKMVCKKCDKDL